MRSESVGGGRRRSPDAWAPAGSEAALSSSSLGASPFELVPRSASAPGPAAADSDSRGTAPPSPAPPATRPVAGGVYIYQIQAEGQTYTGTVVIIK